MSAVDVSDVEALLRRPVTSQEDTALYDILIPGLVEVIELYLNRAVYRRSFMEPLLHADGVVVLGHPPLVTVTRITENATGVVVLQDSYTVSNGQVYVWPYDAYDWTIEYVAGDDPVNPVVRMILAQTLARTVIVSPVNSLGAIGGYSVEGTSINYTGSTIESNVSAVGGIQVGSLNAIERLRRLMFV